MEPAADETETITTLMDDYSLNAWADNNVLLYLEEQAQSTGVVPDDRTVVIERFRDEIGDWRVCILSPFGTPVHAPWAMAIERRLTERYDMPVESMWGDDGIVLRLPDAVDELPIDELLIDPEDIEIDIDAVDAATFWVVDAFVRDCLPGGKKAAASSEVTTSAAHRRAERPSENVGVMIRVDGVKDQRRHQHALYRSLAP